MLTWIVYDEHDTKFLAQLIGADGKAADVFDLAEIKGTVTGYIYENPELLEAA